MQYQETEVPHSLYAIYKPETATPSMINARFPPFFKKSVRFCRDIRESGQGLIWALQEKFPGVAKPLCLGKDRGTQREHSSKPLKHSIVKRILVFKR